MVFQKEIKQGLVCRINTAKTKNGNEYGYFKLFFVEMENNFENENLIKVRFEKSKFPEIVVAKYVGVKLEVLNYNIDNKVSQVYNLIEVLK